MQVDDGGRVGAGAVSEPGMAMAAGDGIQRVGEWGRADLGEEAALVVGHLVAEEADVEARQHGGEDRHQVEVGELNRPWGRQRGLPSDGSDAVARSVDERQKAARQMRRCFGHDGGLPHSMATWCPPPARNPRPSNPPPPRGMGEGAGFWGWKLAGGWLPASR